MINAAKDVTYMPDRIRGLGLRVWAEMVRDLRQSRGLIWRLFVRDWTAQYRQSWLGYLWALVPPVAAVAAFTFLRRHIMTDVRTAVPYVLFGLWGMMGWQFFTGCYTAAAQSLAGSGVMIARLNFHKESLVFASIGRCVFDFLVRAVLLAAVYVYCGIAPPWTAALAPAALLPLLLMALGLGMIMAVIATAGTDVSNAMNMLLNFGMLVTPGVLYPAIERWPGALLNILNPVSPVLLATHDLLERGAVAMPGPYLMAWLFGLLLFLGGWRFFHLALPRVAERF